MKALIFSLTLLLFSVGAAAVDRPHAQAVQPLKAEVVLLPTPSDPGPPVDTDWVSLPSRTEMLTIAVFPAPPLAAPRRRCSLPITSSSIRAPPAHRYVA